MRAAIDALSDASGADASRRGGAARRAHLAAVADAAEESRLSGDARRTGRWAETAGRAGGAGPDHGRPGRGRHRQGPEGLAWLARAEAEGVRAAAGPDVAAWERAVDAFGYGDPYELARCRGRLAEALLVADRREEAAEQAHAARETAVRLGAVPLLEALDALVRRGRLADAGRPGTASRR